MLGRTMKVEKSDINKIREKLLNLKRKNEKKIEEDLSEIEKKYNK
jgi:hypothetical protein